MFFSVHFKAFFTRNITDYLKFVIFKQLETFAHQAFLIRTLPLNTNVLKVGALTV